MHVEMYCFFVNLTNIYLQLIMEAEHLLVCFVIFMFWGKALSFLWIIIYFI